MLEHDDLDPAYELAKLYKTGSAILHEAKGNEQLSTAVSALSALTRVLETHSKIAGVYSDGAQVNVTHIDIHAQVNQLLTKRREEIFFSHRSTAYDINCHPIYPIALCFRRDEIPAPMTMFVRFS